MQHGEIGWSSDYEHFTEYETYQEAKEHYDNIEMEPPNKNYDWGNFYKKLYKIEEVIKNE